MDTFCASASVFINIISKYFSDLSKNWKSEIKGHACTM